MEIPSDDKFNAQISSFTYIKCAIGFVLSLKYFS